MMLSALHVAGVCVVPWWCGWSGALARHRWGVVGKRWPTIYAGPVKLITGPSFR